MKIKMVGKERDWVGLAVLALCAVIFSGMLAPVFKNHSKEATRIHSKKEILKKILKNLPANGQASASARRDVTELLKKLQDIASESSISLMGIKPQSPEEAEEEGRVIFDLSARSDPVNFIRFLYKLESPSSGFRVKRFTVAASSQGSSELQTSLTVSF